MRRALAASLIFAAAAHPGCKEAPKAGPAKADPGTKAVRAAIVFDVGGIDDKSFNELAYKGLMRAKSELAIDVQYYQPSQPADRKTGLRQFAAKGFDIIIGVGFIFSDEMIAMAKDFPSLKFACIDMVDKPDAEIPPNLVGLKFREEQGSFLVGALAALSTKTKKVGFIGGMNVPLIHKFEAGYRAGVKHVAPDIEVVVNYAGETPKAFEDPETGKNRAIEQYKSGVDIIFHASGKTGLGVFQAAKELDKLAIGVDADQYQEAPGHVLTSSTKGVDVVVVETIRAVRDGAFKPGKQIFGLKEGGVGFVYDEHNKSLIPDETYKKVLAIRDEIIAGKIEVPSTR
jgi:basic membrane protein A and related proteins